MIQENSVIANSVCLMFFILFSKDALQFNGAMKSLNKQQQLVALTNKEQCFF